MILYIHPPYKQRVVGGTTREKESGVIEVSQYLIAAAVPNLLILPATDAFDQRLANDNVPTKHVRSTALRCSLVWLFIPVIPLPSLKRTRKGTAVN